MIASRLVAPSDIQAELDLLWNAKENKNKLRASLFNIIFFTKRSPRDEYFHKISIKLIEKFPSRIFFVSTYPDSTEASFKTAVAVMSTEQGEFDITCDFIEMAAAGSSEKEVPFLLLRHIIPDLPIFLVWTEDPGLESPLYESVKQIATRVIFDSESTEDLSRFSKVVLASHLDDALEVADLNWARIESWRDLISSTFCLQETLEQLQKASSITITYNSQETPSFCHTKIQSIYLQAWLATRMNWKPDKKCCSLDLKRFFYHGEKQDIEVELKDIKDKALPPGMILSLEIKTTDEEHFLFTRDAKISHQISLIHSTKKECKLPLKFLVSKGESGGSLVKEICHKGTGKHYLDVLKLIMQWNRGDLC